MRNERFRPRFHYSPAENWLNDPNGLVWYDGEYHLFYQYNPEGTDWGNMSWGHAVSPDLQRWEELPVAIACSEKEQIFSGSIVVDHENTSGFGMAGNPAMVAVYTSCYPGTGLQAQSLAFSTDRGRTWTPYEANPVLDIGSNEFRDPKVFWYDEGGYWVMAVVLAVDHIVQFYRSDDLKDWQHLSDFGPANAVGGVWEVPDLFELPVDGDPENTKWVLVVNLNPGGIAGGSGAQFFIGDFDGKQFTAENIVGEGVRDLAAYDWLDYGADHYAVISFNDIPGGERVLIGWMNNWEYAGGIPTTSFRGSLSLPRTYRLATVNGQVRLIQQPVTSISSLREPNAGIELRDSLIQEGVTPLPERAHGDTLEIRAEFTLGSAERFGLHVRAGEHQRTVVGYDARSASLFVNRRASGAVEFHEAFPGVHRGPLAAEGDLVRMTIYVDRASVEVFGGRGECVITDQIFPDGDSQAVSLFAEGGDVALRYLEVTPLKVI